MACTLCHLGNGRMLTAAGAHGIDPPAAEPRLELRYIQAGCLRCHEGKDADRIAPKVAAGRQLFQASSCFGCHTVEGLSKGTVGPDLTEVGRRRTADYLRAILAEPTMNNPHSPMPPTSASRQADLDCLVTFLLTLRGARQPYVYQQ
jgi:cbb3-type cytochrome oxidase cytochrome c subunit